MGQAPNILNQILTIPVIYIQNSSFLTSGTLKSRVLCNIFLGNSAYDSQRSDPSMSLDIK